MEHPSSVRIGETVAHHSLDEVIAGEQGWMSVERVGPSPHH
jgi:hypothetical protein